MIHNGDHAEFEREHANTKPEDRPDWPLPSFDAVDWAKAFCKIATNLGYKDAEGQPVDEGWMVGWFANALMRGYDEYAKRQARTTPTPTEARERIARALCCPSGCVRDDECVAHSSKERRNQTDAIFTGALLPDAAAIRAAAFEEAAGIARDHLIKRAEYFERAVASRTWDDAARSYRASADEAAAAIRNAGRTG
jgi:hypothetical protein